MRLIKDYSLILFTLINNEQHRSRFGNTLSVTVQRRHLWVVTLFRKYPAQFAANLSI